jgi:hypothetical protein
MGKAGPVVITAGGEKYLGFVLEAAERLGMNDAVTIMLKRGPQVAFVFRHEPAPAVAAQRCPGCQGLFFNLFQLLSDVHGKASIYFVAAYGCQASLYLSGKKKKINGQNHELY